MTRYIAQENVNKIIKAALFAKDAHKTQTRKYTGEPYFNHVEEVAQLVTSVTNDHNMICAAYLHDTVEDCGVSLSTITKEFGPDVADLVEHLTDISKPEDGNRAIRKAMDLRHTANASPRAKTVKLADLISNSRNIVDRDKKFAEVYLREKASLLNVLTEGNQELYDEAVRTLHEGQAKLAL